MKGNEFTIELCDDARYLDDIATMFTTWDYGPVNREWIAWKYEQNPDGFPVFFLAFDNSHSLIGMQAYLPRNFRYNSLIIPTVQAIDAFVVPEYRRRGIYLNMWERTKRILEDRKKVLTTFPSTRGKSIGAMKKSKLKFIGYMESLCCPIRPGKIIQNRKMRFITPLLHLTIDKAWQKSIIKRDYHVTIKRGGRFSGSCTQEIGQIYGERSDNYLNWRFVDNPVKKFHNVSFERDSKIIGYASLKLDQLVQRIYIHDFFVHKSEKECIQALQKYIVTTFPEASLIFYKSLEKGPYRKFFRQCKFYPHRKNQVMFVYNLEGYSLTSRPNQWFVNIGDTDW